MLFKPIAVLGMVVMHRIKCVKAHSENAKVRLTALRRGQL